VTVPLSLEGDRWGVDLARLEAAMTPRTRVLIFCNPHNPVGRVFTERDVRAVAELCRARGVVFCSDEIHADLVLGPTTPTAGTSAESGAPGHGMRHVCAAALGDGSHTIVLMAPSKTFNTPGLSCAFALIPDPAIRNAVRGAARGVITEVNAMGYVACAAAFREGEPWRRALLEVLRGNRDVLYRFVAERMPRVRLRPMEATYLAWLDCRDLGVEDPAGFFEHAGVGVSDGRLFGPGGEGFVRLNFGCPASRLAEALRRMEAALA
jgi:cystathionine beta-lyase